MKEVIAIDKSIIIYRKCESQFYFHPIINGPGIKENGDGGNGLENGCHMLHF